MANEASEKIDWEAHYVEQNTPWDRGGISPALAAWLDEDRLPNGRVLVPGCGRGYEVLRLAELGWQVTAVDLAPSALEFLGNALTERGLCAELIQADLLQWYPTEPFDLIYEQTSLCALRPADWPAYASRLADWIVPGGLLAALFMQTGRDGGPPYHCSLSDMRGLFPESDWYWSDGPAIEIPHPKGVMEYAVLLSRLLKQENSAQPKPRCN